MRQGMSVSSNAASWVLVARVDEVLDRSVWLEFDRGVEPSRWLTATVIRPSFCTTGGKTGTLLTCG